MIELITGTPGAGKTCYAVAKRIVPESGRTVQVEDDCANKIEVTRRVVVAGIRGLAVPHERLPHTLTGERVTASDIDKWNATDRDGEPLHKRLPGEPPQEVEASLYNWWLWCRPGDLIVCDEIQYIVPRGTLGRDPPHYIKAMEVHRHYGIDFLLITQDPTLLDTTMRRLVGMHRHVRSVMGTSLCMVYEWDHASNTERLRNAAKSTYRRTSAMFKLYKSTVAVIAPPKAGGRLAVVLIPCFLVLFVLAVWKFSQRFTSPSLPLPIASAHAAAPLPGARQAAAPAPRQNPPGWEDVPKLAGCYTVGDRCSCQDVTGRAVNIALAMCRASASSFDGLVRWEPRPAPASGPAYGAAAGAARPASGPSL